MRDKKVQEAFDAWRENRRIEDAFLQSREKSDRGYGLTIHVLNCILDELDRLSGVVDSPMVGSLGYTLEELRTGLRNLESMLISEKSLIWERLDKIEEWRDNLPMAARLDAVENQAGKISDLFGRLEKVEKGMGLGNPTTQQEFEDKLRQTEEWAETVEYHERGATLAGHKGRNCGECVWVMAFGPTDHRGTCRSAKTKAHTLELTAPACPEFVER